MNNWQSIEKRLEAEQKCVLITITAVKGSAPRETGAAMVIYSNGSQTGTIGGGALEWQATRQAQDLLAKNDSYLWQEKELILGPDLEQCCGGVVRLSFELFTIAEKKQVMAKAQRFEQMEKPQNLIIFGAGHIGKALIQALSPHGFDVLWVDSRDKIFPSHMPENVRTCHTDEPVEALSGQAPETFVLIMTHSHDVDFQIACKALQTPEIGFAGLIGSATKKARFVRRFAEQGLSLDQIARLTCPVGIAGITSKTPQAIAASVTAQLLIETELVKTGKKNVCLQQIHA